MRLLATVSFQGSDYLTGYATGCSDNHPKHPRAALNDIRKQTGLVRHTLYGLRALVVPSSESKSNTCWDRCATLTHTGPAGVVMNS